MVCVSIILTSCSSLLMSIVDRLQGGQVARA
jgi:hypothetical protein